MVPEEKKVISNGNANITDSSSSHDMAVSISSEDNMSDEDRMDEAEVDESDSDADAEVEALSESDSESDLSSDGAAEMGRPFGINRRIVNPDPQSSDDSSASEASMADEGNVFPLPKVLTYPKPKHNWFVVKEILKRETGNFRNPISFTRRFYGSLHTVQRLELVLKLDRHSGCVNALHFNTNGSRLISGSDDRLVAIWDWTGGRCITTFNSGHSSNVFQCRYLPFTENIVTCSRDGQVRLALQNSTGTYDSTETLAHHSRACHKLSIVHQDPHIVLSAGADAQVFSIDVREKKAERFLFVKEHNKKVNLYSVHVNPFTGQQFCVSGEDYYIRIYDRRYVDKPVVKYYPRHLKKPLSVYVTSAVYNYNGTEVMGSYNDDDIYLFDTSKPTGTNYAHKYEGHRNSETVKGVSFFGPKSEYVVSGSDCGNIYFWDKNTEAIVQWMKADEEGVVNCLEPHPKIPVLASSGLDADVKLWMPTSEREPTMNGIAKTIKENQKKQEGRSIGSRDSLNDTLIRWWRHMRYLHRQQSFRDGSPIFIELGSVPATRFEDIDSLSDTSSMTTSSSCSSDATV